VTLLYDGDCAFCATCAEFVRRRVPTDARIVPWQRTDLPALGVSREQCLEAVQYVAPGRPVRSGPAAIAALLRASPSGWRLLGVALGLPGVEAVSWPVYRWIARHRHRLPGGTAACAVPLPTGAPAAAQPP
jgi:predicted DCC family thiol-disulfide oxidoreductase YuxK